MLHEHGIESVFKAFMRGDIHPLYSEMYPGLLRYASSLLDGRVQFLAEDVVQFAIERAFGSRRDFHDAWGWRTWLYTVIRNKAVELMRRAGLSDTYAAQSDDEQTLLLEAETAAIEQEALDAIFSAVDALPDKYRDIFRLSFAEGMRNAEIAEALGIAEITVKKRKAKLIDLLRTRLSSDAYLLLLSLPAWVLSEP